jgi:hypothetical protein
MRTRRALSTARIARSAAGLLAVAVLGSGCMMPRRGTAIFVDHRAGNFWSGKGLLLEVSDDQQRCHVAVRDRALFVRKPWVECTRVHPRSAPPSV